jgi:prepilin-type N-terminal cleavage/methylation domain-containing protein
MVTVQRTRASRRPAFTLVELLVTLGIIAILISILLPTLSKVREQSRRTVCLSNVAQITKAALLYASDNRNTLPEAGTANHPDAYLSPRAVGLPAWSYVAPDTYVLPSICQSLWKYLGNNNKVWQCPSASDRAFQWGGTDPLGGTNTDDISRPNYKYMAAKEAVPAFPSLGKNVNKYHLKDWAVRNVAGLKTTRVAAPQRNNPSQVVLFWDWSPTFHASTRNADIYADPPVEAHYWASYGYLDGHVAGAGYDYFDDYLKVFHNPIPQTWFGIDFDVYMPLEAAGKK